jgi:hypothetical protein
MLLYDLLTRKRRRANEFSEGKFMSAISSFLFDFLSPLRTGTIKKNNIFVLIILPFCREHVVLN